MAARALMDLLRFLNLIEKLRRERHIAAFAPSAKCRDNPKTSPGLSDPIVLREHTWINIACVLSALRSELRNLRVKIN